MALTCSITGCDRLAKARGWCNKHYLRWRRTGDPDNRRIYPLKRTAGYVAVHLWLSKHFPRTGRCEFCARTGCRTEYAKTTKHLSRWRHDWLELCVSCHKAFDGLMGPRARCRRGHILDEANTQVRSDGTRYCRACAYRRRRELRREAVV